VNYVPQVYNGSISPGTTSECGGAGVHPDQPLIPPKLRNNENETKIE
jgi:hypothetical protein